jgi:hypothetical protein
MTFYYLCGKSVVERKKLSADGKPAFGRTRILTDSGRKRNRKEVLANHKLGNKNWTLH